MAEEFSCGAHTAFLFTRGGGTNLGELTPLSAVQWQRVRDEVSSANVSVATAGCCELLGDARCIQHELHIYRNGTRVWCGPVTRIEYEVDKVQLFAEDLLWQTKRTVIQQGYSNAYPNIGLSMDNVNNLLRAVYPPAGNPWNVTLQPMYNPTPGDAGPRTSKVVHRYQEYVYDDVDSYAADGGIDYLCVNRRVYYNDTHLAWNDLPDMDEQWISEWPRVVEYGMQVATWGVVTDGFGHGVNVQGPPEWDTAYGRVDLLTSLVDDKDVAPEAPPTPDELLAWSSIAQRAIGNRAPAPLALVIPANSTLMPGAPWVIEDLLPGSWFRMSVSRYCRPVHSEWQKLDEVVVTETPEQGEQVHFSAATAPAGRIDWVPPPP